jgi:hypothetical protein
VELFDLEIPIRSTGGAQVKADLKGLETAGTQAAAKLGPALKQTEAALAGVGAKASAATLSLRGLDGSVLQVWTQVGAAAKDAAAGVSAVGDAAKQSAPATTAMGDALKGVGDAAQGVTVSVEEAIQHLQRLGVPADAMAGALQKMGFSAEQAAKALQVSGKAADDHAARTTKAAAATREFIIQLSRPFATRLPTNLAIADARARMLTEGLRGVTAQSVLAASATQRLALGVNPATASLMQGAQAAGAFRNATAAAGASAISSATVFNRFRNVLSAMVATAIGATGAMGTLGGTLLAFSAGTGVALAAVAGIAAIAFAFQKLTARTREQKRITDELRESFRKLNDEMNNGPQAQRATEQKAASELRRRLATLESELARAEARPSSADPEEQQARRVQLTRIRNDIAKARQELRASEAALGDFDARQSVENAEARRKALMTLVAAGQASAAQEQELRDELAKTKAELAGLTPVYAATTAGIQRKVELTERAAAIEAAFRRETAETTKATDAATESLAERTQILLALLALEEPTAERWAELRARADVLTEALAAGNVPLEERVALLRELASIEAGTGFGAVAPGLDFQPQRPTLRGIEAPTQEGQSAGAPDSLFEGDSISARLHRAIVESGKTAEEAAAIAAEQFHAAGASLAASFEQGLVGAFESLGRGGSFGQMIAGFAGQMLQALGNMAIKFGVAVSGIGALMESAMKALASLNPFVAIAAGVALVALGSALGGAASKSFGGSAPGGSGGELRPITTTYRVPASNLAQARESAMTGTMPKAVTPISVNYFGKGRDPGFSRWLTEQVGQSQARGVRG